MKVDLQSILSDSHLDANQKTHQRQLLISISAITEIQDRNLPLNLCLIIDCSGSMTGQPIKIVKEAAISIIEKLHNSDRISVICFNHQAKVLIYNQNLEKINQIKSQIQKLEPDGGTSIDDGMKLGITEAIKGKDHAISQVFLLTDGENEHGNNDRCLKLAKLAVDHKITINTLGFGNHWNQEILEEIADYGSGTLSYIERPSQAIHEFQNLFTRVKSVGLINAYLIIELQPNVNLAQFKPIAQIEPEIIELKFKKQSPRKYLIRLGDLMTNHNSRSILVNFYCHNLPLGYHEIANIQVCYDDPASNKVEFYSEKLPVIVEIQKNYQPELNPKVQKSILALAKYRQTKIAKAKLEKGDHLGAVTMLQTAANTAIQLGDTSAATVLQISATHIQSGKNLSEAEQKKTMMVSKTILNPRNLNLPK